MAQGWIEENSCDIWNLGNITFLPNKCFLSHAHTCQSIKGWRAAHSSGLLNKVCVCVCNMNIRGGGEKLDYEDNDWTLTWKD